MASISIRCPSCSATEGVVRNGKSTTILSSSLVLKVRLVAIKKQDM
ncbi:hypothetical protein FQP73_09990 [Escherichia coli]|nr:hypothetical protein [Escherichia coli]